MTGSALRRSRFFYGGASPDVLAGGVITSERSLGERGPERGDSRRPLKKFPEMQPVNTDFLC